MGSEWGPPIEPITPATWTRESVRLVLLLLASLGMVTASLFLVAWFTARMPNGQISSFAGVSEFSIGLRSLSTCDQQPGMYCEIPLEVAASYAGLRTYLTPATLTFWTSLVLAALVVLQVGARLVIDCAPKRLNIVAYIAGILTMTCAFATAYVFGPAFGPFDIEPTIAPAVLVMGCVLGIITVYYAARPSRDTRLKAAEPVVPVARAQISRSKR